MIEKQTVTVHKDGQTNRMEDLDSEELMWEKAFGTLLEYQTVIGTIDVQPSQNSSGKKE